MLATPLSEKLTADGKTKMGEYCGVQTPLSFGDTPGEFADLLHRCGVYDLGWRAHLRIRGQDRVRWLNGMVSNNTRDLPAGHGNYNFLLSAQGRIQGDLYVYNCGEEYIAETDFSQLENILKLLRKYIIMDKVELADLREEITAIGVQGPDARSILAKAEISGPLPEALELRVTEWKGRRVLVTRMATEPRDSFELWTAPSEVHALWNALQSAGAKPVGADALEFFRVAAGIPRYGIDIRSQDLPQETAQMQALCFTKGCYIGQEIVERIRSRGSVHRTLAGFMIDGPPPEAGARVQAGGKDVGEITCAVELPAAGTAQTQALALGYLRREAAMPGFAVQVGNLSGLVSELPFTSIFAKEHTHAE
ncbi:MAG: folate-binding protein [Terriglobales bacterium]|jgi:folate-binding protein YgfZ